MLIKNADRNLVLFVFADKIWNITVCFIEFQLVHTFSSVQMQEHLQMAQELQIILQSCKLILKAYDHYITN